MNRATIVVFALQKRLLPLLSVALLCNILLLASASFAVWNYTLNVSVHDLNGNAVEGADVRIVYQKLSALSEDDGVLTGKTGAGGSFLAPLENKVPSASQSFRVEVAVSTYTGQGKRGSLTSTSRSRRTPASQSLWRSSRPMSKCCQAPKRHCRARC